LLEEACQIGNSLVQQAEWKQNLVWKTLRANKEKKILWQYSENLYDGVAGVALFLIELSYYSQSSLHTEAAEESFQKLMEYCRQNPTSRHGFYSGRMGVSYVAYRFFEITGKQIYLAAAFELARNATDFLISSPPDEIFSGTSGTLLGLLHLHVASDKYDKSQLPWLENLISEYIIHILNKAKVWRQGLYWDKSPQQIQGLCGFTHGAAGVGFVLLETARYFNIKSLEYIAEQAFFYESLHYNETNNNWTDLRKRLLKDGEPDPEHEIHFRNQRKDYFNQGNDINAWCNGAVGIGLSRLRAFEILGKTHYKKEVEHAIKKTIDTTIKSISLEQECARSFV
jgi:lantibiotic modifying enzyme